MFGRSYNSQEEFAAAQNKMIGIAKKSAIGVAIAVIGFSAISIVPEGHRGVRTRFSEAKEITSQGLNFKIPFIEKIHSMTVMTDSAEIQRAEGATKDTQPVTTSLVVRYQNDPKEVLRIYKEYSRDGDLDKYVQTASQEAFKAVTARYSADELISKRNEVSQAVTTQIQAKIEKFGADVVSVDMTQFSFGADYMKAISAKVTEEQQKLAEMNKLERIKVEQQQKVVVAQAEADATIATAKAKAEAVRLEAQALRDNMSILELRRIEVAKIQAERWDGKLPTTSLGGAIPMINLSTK